MDKIETAGITISLIAILATLILISQTNFPAFTYATEDWKKIGTSDNVGLGTANFIWNYRFLDLVAQAVVLFGAAVGCLAILREEKEEEKHA